MGRRTTCLALAAAAVAAGCGGTSLDDYADRANAICGDIRSELTAATGGPRTSQTQVIIARTTKADRAFARGVERLEALERPGGEDGERAQQFTVAIDRLYNKGYRPAFARLRAALRRGDRPAARRAVIRLSRADTTTVNRLSRELGLDRCGATR